MVVFASVLAATLTVCTVGGFAAYGVVKPALRRRYERKHHKAKKQAPAAVTTRGSRKR